MSATQPLAQVLRHIRTLAGEKPEVLSDAQLLDQFVKQRDDAAFAQLVARHGPMVLGVAQRWLADRHEADDVVQSTFMALARQAKRLDRRKPLSGWLYTVAFRLARKAQARTARRRRLVVSRNETIDPLAAITGRELLRALDEELAKLPERYRVPLLLCSLDGLTRDEAAERLGLNLGEIRGRLERGRELLRKRLEARGLTLPAALAGVLVADGSTAMSAPFVAAVTKAALAVPAVGSAKFAALAGVLLLAMGTGAGLALWPDDKGKEQATANPPVAHAPDSPRVDALGDPLPDGALARLGTQRLRPGNFIEALAFSPDGGKLACWGGSHFEQGRLTIWQIPSGRLLREIPMPKVQVKLLAWRPDGRGVAIVQTGRNEYAAWDFTNDKSPVPQTTEALNIGALDGDFLAMALSPDGRMVATGQASKAGKAGAIEIREFAYDRSLKQIPARTLGVLDGHGVGLLFTHDSRELVAISRTQEADREMPSASGAIMIISGKLSETARLAAFDVKSGRLISQFNLASPTTLDVSWSKRRQDPRSMAFIPGSDKLVVGREDGRVSVWDWRKGQELKAFMAHPAVDPIREWPGVVAIAASPDGKVLTTVGRIGRLQRWDIATGLGLNKSTGGGIRFDTMAVSNDGNTIAAGGNSGKIVVDRFDSADTATKVIGHDESVESIHVTADGQSASTAGTDGVVIRWDLATGRERNRLALDAPRMFWPSGFETDGNTLNGRNSWMNTTNHANLLFDSSNGKRLPLAAVFQVETNAILGMPRRGTTLLLNLREESLSIRDWTTGALRHQLPLPEPEAPAINLKINAGTLSDDGKLAASVGEDQRNGLRGYGHINLWNAATGEAIHRWHSADAIHQHVVITADNRWLVVGGSPMRANVDSQAILLFDTRSGEMVRSFAPAEPTEFRYIKAIATSPDSRLIAAAERNHSICIYELATGKLRRKLTGHFGDVNTLVFTPDSRRLISGSADQTALVWDVGP